MRMAICWRSESGVCLDLWAELGGPAPADAELPVGVAKRSTPPPPLGVCAGVAGLHLDTRSPPAPADEEEWCLTGVE